MTSSNALQNLINQLPDAVLDEMRPVWGNSQVGAIKRAILDGRKSLEEESTAPAETRISGMEHTPGKLGTHPVASTNVIYTIKKRKAVEICRTPANTETDKDTARRIVACWNATAGIPTETLEEMPRIWVENRAELDIEFSRRMHAEIDRLKQENAELVEVLNAALRHQIANIGSEDEFYICYTYPGKKMPEWVSQARAALSKHAPTDDTPEVHPSQPAQVIANLTRKLGGAIKALRDISEALRETTGGFAVGEGNVKYAWETAKKALKPYEPDSPDPCDLARDFNDDVDFGNQPTEYDRADPEPPQKTTFHLYQTAHVQPEVDAFNADPDKYIEKIEKAKEEANKEDQPNT